MVKYSHLIRRAADPVAAANRLERMLEDSELRDAIATLPESVMLDMLNIISVSSFLYHFICRHPQAIHNIGKTFALPDAAGRISTMDELRVYKYSELLKITWMDMSGREEYPRVLTALSELAEYCVNETIRLCIRPEHNRKIIEQHLCTFALGKLGASELNFSSDIDLIFVCSNPADVELEQFEYQKILQDGIRQLSNQLEQRNGSGFLYRVDLKLRPWGSSGPLVMPIDETEQYYEASSETWERFAWLRARAITGPKQLADELKQRLHPFVFRRSLSSDDLDRFVEIKNEMFKARRRKGFWNVKVGEGGIRDLEFFIQILQLVNASGNDALQMTGTLNVLSGLNAAGLIADKDAGEIRHSYLFLRRLENRLQMFDEQQTHELPDDARQRLVIARSLGITGSSDNEIIDSFETSLFASRSIAKSYFERILPDKAA